MSEEEPKTELKKQDNVASGSTVINDSTTTDGNQLIIDLEKFSGPLDLLLHLIKKHAMDIFDIQISVITEKYLEYVSVMSGLNLDRAGDFLVMASTLAHIKSKMLLPPGEEAIEEEEEQGDPREELVRRLLEYQKYKQAAETLSSRPMLGRDVFSRPPEKKMAASPDEIEMEDVNVFQLIEVFQEMLEKAKKHAPHQVQMDDVKVEDQIDVILNVLRKNKRVTFRELFFNIYTRSELVAMFLGILELTRLNALKLYQTSDKGEIYISIRKNAPSDDEIRNKISAENIGESSHDESSHDGDVTNEDLTADKE